MEIPRFYYFAATGYNCDAYGANNYGECSATSTGSSGSGSSGGLLADTGYAVLVPMALAVAIAGAAVILLVKRMVRRDRSKKNDSKSEDLV